MQGFLSEERGSTRLALAIGATVIALLAAAAMPFVFGQARRAQDTSARSAVADLARQVRACRVGARGYGDCDERRELRDLSAVHWGRRPGQAGVLPDRSAEQSFTAYAVSGSGARIYVWINGADSVVKQTCPHGSVRPPGARGLRRARLVAGRVSFGCAAP